MWLYHRVVCSLFIINFLNWRFVAFFTCCMFNFSIFTLVWLTSNSLYYVQYMNLSLIWLNDKTYFNTWYSDWTPCDWSELLSYPLFNSVDCLIKQLNDAALLTSYFSCFYSYYFLQLTRSCPSFNAELRKSLMWWACLFKACRDNQSHFFSLLEVKGRSWRLLLITRWTISSWDSGKL